MLMAVLAAAPAPVVHPHRGDLLDLGLLALAGLAAFAGFRRGLVVAVLSAGGFLAGALIGSRIAPGLAHGLLRQVNGGQQALAERLVALVIVLAAAMLVQTAAVTLGVWLRRLMSLTPARLVDAAGGAALDVIAVLLVAWLIASAVALAPYATARREIRGSAILTTVNKVMPSVAARFNARLDRLLQQHTLPSVVGPFAGIPIPPGFLSAPDAGVVPPALHAAGAEVVKIRGDAPSCSRSLEGSGFVVSAQHVLTNAHVVAGVRDPSVILPAPGAAVLPARVVLFDPDRDVAILDVPGLTRPALRFAGPAATGASAVVAGYPQNGPLTANPARVAGEQPVTGPNIYDSRDVTRQVYTVRATVRPGNSGGPLLSPAGTVYGVVFAASVDQPDVGYALTAAEVAGDVSRGASATTPVSTRGCD